MRAILGGRLGAAAMTLTLSACFAVVDVDRFHISQKVSSSTSDASVPNQAGTYLDFKFSLVGMKPHLTQMFEYRIIDSSNFVQSRGVVNPLGAQDVVINVPHAIPTANGPFHLDFYADVDGSGGYNLGDGGTRSVISNDHSWRIDPLVDAPASGVAVVDGLVQVTFTHNTSFTDINTYPSGTPNISRDTGLGAVIHVINADALHGVLLQVRVVEPVANRTVGLFRVPQVGPPLFDMIIPGVVENLSDYVVYAYADANGNGVYDNPAVGPDLGWRLTGTAGGGGLEVTLDALTTSAAKYDVGAP
ncbi:MAG: hypothetical protein M3O36_05065 [Myxococcota bacterium]|nr:hypothetical protein [Myxococcota bacterium]